MRWLAVFGLAALLASPAAAAPQRIASIHLCADQLLLLLAERERIVSVSYFAADPHFSAMAEVARGLHLNHGLAEELLSLKPDIVFAGGYSVRPTAGLLRRLGHRVVDLPFAESFDDVRRNIRLVAGAIGREDAGAGLIASFDAALAALPPPPPASKAPVAALYWAKGYTPASASLAAEATRRAGFVDLATSLGLQGASRLPLERLLLLQPDILAMPSGGPAALASMTPRHPVLETAFGPGRRVAVPDRLWTCGAPAVVAAVERLAAFRVQGE